MKTTARQLTTYGNIALVQIEARPETTFPFSPGEPEIRNGRLIISEATGQGIVGKLIAENLTGAFLLLTDADVLIGAKQNRVLNKSVLLAPGSKTILDVSCIERLRWHYTTNNFTAPGPVADSDLREEKLRSVARKKTSPATPDYETQSQVWDHISKKMASANFESATESYASMIYCKIDMAKREFPACNPEKGCNGLAVLIDGKVSCIDLFGTEEVFRHYFPKLRDSAFSLSAAGKDVKPVDVHEAYFRVLDAIDTFEAATRHTDDSYAGAGSFKIVEGQNMVGFELNREGEMVHDVVFVR